MRPPVSTTKTNALSPCRLWHEHPNVRPGNCVSALGGVGIRQAPLKHRRWSAGRKQCARPRACARTRARLGARCACTWARGAHHPLSKTHPNAPCRACPPNPMLQHNTRFWLTNGISPSWLFRTTYRATVFRNFPNSGSLNSSAWKQTSLPCLFQIAHATACHGANAPMNHGSSTRCRVAMAIREALPFPWRDGALYRLCCSCSFSLAVFPGVASPWRDFGSPGGIAHFAGISQLQFELGNLYRL